MLSSNDDVAESAELVVNLVTFKHPDLQELDDIKIVLAAFVRSGRVVEALEQSRKVSLTQVQAVADAGEKEVEQASKMVSDIVYFIFDTCFTGKEHVLSESRMPTDHISFKAVPALSTALDKLLYMPLSQAEDAAMMSWLSEALASNSKLPEANLSLLTEWVTGRLMAQGR